jgi:hypothetical protein
MTDENSKEISTLSPEGTSEEVGQDITPELAGNKPIQKRKRGRPPGSKNKDTIFKELMQQDFQALATTEVKKVFNVLFEKAQDGDIQAIKLVLDRVIPVTKAVDLADMEKRGLTVNISVGALEDSPLVTGEVIEGDFEEVEDA